MADRKTNVYALVESALMIALGTILSMIKIYTMPWGGSVTLLSMLPFIMLSFRRGIKWGLLTGFANALLQMLLGFYAPPAGTIPAFIGVIMLDYLLAFTLLGIAGAFSKVTRHFPLNVAIGTALVCIIRFLCSFLSGALLWGSYQSYYEWADGLSVWLYSFIYNGTYMLPETVLTTVCAVLIAVFYPKLLKKQ